MTHCWFQRRHVYDGLVPIGSVQVVGGLDKIIRSEDSLAKMQLQSPKSRKILGSCKPEDLVMEIPLNNCHFLVIRKEPFVSGHFRRSSKTAEDCGDDDFCKEEEEKTRMKLADTLSISSLSSLHKEEAGTMRYAWLYFRPVSLVLDLDMTLVHCIELTLSEHMAIKKQVSACGISWEMFLHHIDGFDFHHQFEDEIEPTYFLGKFRDGVREFIDAFNANPFVEMFLCSAGTRLYVRAIVDLLPPGTFKHVWAREDLDHLITFPQDLHDGCSKGLSRMDIRFDLRRTMIVDDNPHVWDCDDCDRILVVDKYSYFPSPQDMMSIDFSPLKKGRTSNSAYLNRIRDDILTIIRRFQLKGDSSIENMW
jgi:hypothetical protein